MKSGFSVEQIIKLLRDTEIGLVQEVCGINNISKNTYYKWRREYGGMEVKEAQRLKALEKENADLKKMYAESELQIRALK